MKNIKLGCIGEKIHCYGYVSVADIIRWAHSHHSLKMKKGKIMFKPNTLFYFVN